MLKTVSQLKLTIESLMDGLTVSTVSDIDDIIERSARILLSEVSIPESSARQNLTLFGNVFDYLADTEMFGASVVDLYPQGNSRTAADRTTRIDRMTFDRLKNALIGGNELTVEYDNGVPILRIVPSVSLPSVKLDTMAATTGWTAAGSASALTEDDVDFYDSPASLKFTLTGSSTGTLTKSITSQDLTDYENVGTAFLAIKVPTAASLTSITLKLGSSAAAYDPITATTGQLGSWTDGKWLLVPFDFSTAVSVGTPLWSAIHYAQVSIAHTGTLTNFRVGGLFISLPAPYELLYETSAIFKAGSANPSTMITSDTDTIILNDDAYTLFEQECALNVCPPGSVDRQTFQTVLHGIRTRYVNQAGLYEKYRGRNPVQRLKEIRTSGSTRQRLTRRFR